MDDTMIPIKQNKRFVIQWLSSLLLFAFLLLLSVSLELYKKLPVFGFIGYGLVILNLLWALNRRNFEGRD
jgi:hypothetical protein